MSPQYQQTNSKIRTLATKSIGQNQKLQSCDIHMTEASGDISLTKIQLSICHVEWAIRYQETLPFLHKKIQKPIQEKNTSMQITVAVNGSAKNTNKKQRNTKHETTKNIADQWPHEVDGWIGGSTYASVPLSEVPWPPLWPLLLFPITIIIVIIVIVITIFIVIISTVSTL